jgi:hypothetical protein
MILGRLKNKKTKHVNAVRDHIFYLHRKMSTESIQLDELKGKPLNAKVKQIQAISKRMKQYQRYLNLVLL